MYLKTDERIRKINLMYGECEKARNELNFEQAIVCMVEIYELALNTIISESLRFTSIRDMVSRYEDEKQVRIDNWGMGHYIGLINKNPDIIERMLALQTDQHAFTNRDILVRILNDINEIRKQVVHPNLATRVHFSIDKDKFDYYFIVLKLFLTDFGLLDFKDPRRGLNTIAYKPIIGEVNLYNSLISVLTTYDIDMVDATYYSAKLPYSSSSIVRQYWNMLYDKLCQHQIFLRRIISLDTCDQYNYKLKWLLTEQVPLYWPLLNEQVFLGLFMTSNDFTGIGGRDVRLINLILMYRKEEPEKGHVWLFNSHPESVGREQEYLYLYDDENFMFFRGLFNDSWDSSLHLNAQNIREIMRRSMARTKTDDYQQYIEQITGDLSRRFKLQLTNEQIHRIKETYKSIFEGATEHGISAFTSF